MGSEKQVLEVKRGDSGWRGPEQRNKASHETGAVMIQTVAKNSCPYLTQTAQFFLVQKYSSRLSLAAAIAPNFG